MKIRKILCLFIISIVFFSCSKDDSSGDGDNTPKDEYHFVATIDGTKVDFINIIGDYTPIYSLFNSQSIYIEAWSQNQDFPYTITMSLFEDDLALGTYQLSPETFSFSDALYLGIGETTFAYVTEEVLKSGTITITEIDRENDVLAGNFELDVDVTTYKDPENPEFYNISAESGSFRIRFPIEK